MPAKHRKNTSKGVTPTCPAGPEQPVNPPFNLSEGSSWEFDKLVKFDFVRFTYADIHGIGRCRSVPRRHVEEYLTKGVDIYTTGFFILFLNKNVVSNSCLCCRSVLHVK